jgi:tRNA A37 threonylcarbamoyladenosine dehydratase
MSSSTLPVDPALIPNEVPRPAARPAGTHRRFDRIARLVGEPAMDRLSRCTVAVFGQGGVGSFAAEALCRSGVGELRLVDFDRVCITNVNRQLHAMRGTVGKKKAEVMGERLSQINPDARIDIRPEFYGSKTCEALLLPRPDFVVDAIDNITAKVHLLHTCKERGIPVVSAMGAAARLDPTRIRVADVSRTEKCPFARDVRKILRTRYGHDLSQPLGIQAVYSEEEPVAPHALRYDTDGFQCVCPHGHNDVHTCDRRARIDGSAAFVTATFGMMLASIAVRGLL